MVDPAPAGHKTWGFRITYQSQGFTGYRHTAFHFRTDRNKVKKFPECSGNVAVVFVAPIKSDFVAQQTGADPDSYLFFISGFHRRSLFLWVYITSSVSSEKPWIRLYLPAGIFFRAQVCFAPSWHLATVE
jgi:hypothetical protein